MELIGHLRSILKEGVFRGLPVEILLVVVVAFYLSGRSIGGVIGYLRPVLKELREGIDSSFRIDIPLTLIIVAHLIFFLPVVARNTENPRALAAFSNDEPFLTLALDGTTSWPFGNPANFLNPDSSAYGKIPPRWEDRRYPNITYYGGATYQIAFPPYAVTRLVGLPAFPTAPIILRLISLFAGLGSLMILYNLVRFRNARVAGALACIFLVSDNYFDYYTTNIHPDTLQLFFALLAFIFAVRSVNSAHWASLAVFGLMTGVVQGTKVGGPWMIPIVTAVICFSVIDHWNEIESKGRSNLIARHVWILSAAALAGYVISTPYAFIDGYYFRALVSTLGMVNQDHLRLGTTFFSWIDAAWAYFGWFGAALVLLAVMHLALKLSRKEQDRTLSLGILLSASQFFWFATMDALWVVLGYLLVAMGLMAVFGFEALLLGIGGFGRIVQRLFSTESKVPSVIVFTAAGALFLLFIDARWYSPVSYALTLRLNSANTVRAINNWAEQSRISERTSILYDDLSYFDPKRFPNAHMHGGVLTWPAVLRKHPDIVVLCSSLYGAAWYQNLIAIQRLDRQSMDPFSMRLYQDLLPSRHFRVPHLPEVTLLKTINPPQEMAPLPPERTEWGLKKLWTVDSVRIAQLARYKKMFAAQREGVLGVVGPELKIYALDWRNVRRPKTEAVSKDQAF